MDIKLLFWRPIKFTTVFLAGAALSALYFLQEQEQELIPEATAIHAADSFVRHVYSEELAHSVQPYNAYLVDYIWVVNTPWDSRPGITGRGMEIYVNGYSGAIITHRNNK